MGLVLLVFFGEEVLSLVVRANGKTALFVEGEMGWKIQNACVAPQH
jgi:hypothetical protein